MQSSPRQLFEHVLILKADRVCGDALKQSAQRILPASTIVSAGSLGEAEEALAVRRMDLLISGISAPDGDVLDLITEGLANARFARVLVVTARCEEAILMGLRGLRIEGVFDPASEGLREFGRALRVVVAGGEYWSPSVVTHLMRWSAPPYSLLQRLTRAEQLVLALIGDGSDDQTAAACLGVKPASILSIRRDLHRKLRVQHKGDLIKVAVQAGFVRFTPKVVVRPGFGSLLAEPRVVSRRPITRERS